MDRQHGNVLASSGVEQPTKYDHLRNLTLAVLLGGGAAFMMFPILEDWPLIVTVVLTALSFSLAGYVFRRIARHGAWFSGLVINVPLWLLAASWGIPHDTNILAALGTAVVAAYCGMIMASRFVPAAENRNAVTSGGG